MLVAATILAAMVFVRANSGTLGTAAGMLLLTLAMLAIAVAVGHLLARLAQ